MNKSVDVSPGFSQTITLLLKVAAEPIPVQPQQPVMTTQQPQYQVQAQAAAQPQIVEGTVNDLVEY